MTARLVEGWSFPPHFTLINRTGQDESWLASNDITHEKVRLKIFTRPIDATTWQGMIKALGSLRGLIHQNISPVLEYGETDGLHYWSERYVEGGEHFSPQGQSSSRIWQILDALLTAIQYAHQLGIAHGRLHPGHLIVAPSGDVHITGWGVPAALCDDVKYQPWLSPEARDAQAPDLSDDYYSIGYLIFHSLTGKQWQPDATLDRPLPSKLALLLAKMLQTPPYERAVDLQTVQAALTAHFDQSNASIQPIVFERGAPRQEQTTTGQKPVITRGHGKVSTSRVLTALAVLIVISLPLFWWLPGIITPASEDVPADLYGSDLHGDKQNTSANRNITEPPVIPPVEQARLDYLKEKSQQVARELLRRQVQLENLGTILWANENFTTLVSATDAADDLYRNHDYAAALESYQQIITAMDTLLDTATSVLAEQIKIGNAALDEGKHRLALRAFTIASVIDQGNENIMAKLARAENLEQVLAFMQQGESLERSGQLKDALAAYLEARSLDNAWQPGRLAVRRVRGALTQQHFSDAMSLAFSAFAAGDYGAAESHFTQARKILPGSPEPADGLLQVQQARNRDRINAHSKQADDLLATSHWRAAIAQYEAALVIDPTLVFATRGIADATARLELGDRLELYLSDPGLMQEDKALDLARETLVAASRIEPKPEKWAAHIDTLARLISTARTPIPVIITSDNKTAVTVYKVGQFGILISKQLALIPGYYTMVGKRPGYRDVRHNLAVRSGETPAPIEIICSEKI